MKKKRTALEKKRRASARIALYSSLALVGLLLVGGLQLLGILAPKIALPDWVGIDYESMTPVQRLQSYLQIDTSKPDGDEVAGANYLASQLRAAGLEATVEVLGPKKANMWSLLEGDDPNALVLHSHIDTDPVVYLEEWRVPPYSGKIEMPWLYGRGAYDMKGVAIAQLEAFLALAAKGRPKRSVLFLATGSEEAGSDIGMKWILEQHPELSERFWAMLTEGGVVETRSAAAAEEDFVKWWGIEFAQKRYVDVTLCSENREKLEILRKALLRQRRQEHLDVKVVPEVSAFLTPYAPTRFRPDLKRAFSDPHSLALDPVGYRKLSLYQKAMFRDEALPFPVEEDPQGGYRLLVKFHLLPGSDFEEARRRLMPAWMTHGMAETVYDERGADHGSPLDHPVFQTLVEKIRQHAPHAPIGPHFLPWTATDSRFVRARDVPSYGFSPFKYLTPDSLRVGRINERISVPEFVDGVELYVETVEALANL